MLVNIEKKKYFFNFGMQKKKVKSKKVKKIRQK